MFFASRCQEVVAVSEERSVHLPVDRPAVEHRIHVAAQIGGRRGGSPSKQGMIAGTSDDDAAMAMAREHDAQTPGVEMEAVGFRKPSQWVNGDHKVELKALQSVRRVDHDVRASWSRQHGLQCGNLIPMGRSHGDTPGLQGTPLPISFAPKHRLSAQQVIDYGPSGFHEVWLCGQRDASGEIDVGPPCLGGMIDRSTRGGPCAKS